MSTEPHDLVILAAGIVTAYATRNPVAVPDIAELIGTVHNALQEAADGKAAVVPAEPALVPAVPIRKSITGTHIICLENGLKFRSLKRHLLTYYGLTPDAYRAKWGLPADYPMVAPDYAAERSRLAKSTGLGRKKVEPPPPPPEPEPAPKPRRGRPPKVATA
ncbi:MucR family transcriptional regulator [Prosthecomicrobium hirschii]|uniref:MucR family transcriptional regulator n=1 Tax=Prosthecodimorpha hirschii TaxID=665126 RepID=UPI00221E4103|nr:MucR family transcriptional regulator [Prosthecomicrobium hirschii]